MGIPIGLLLGWPIGRLLLPAIVNMLTDDIRANAKLFCNVCFAHTFF